MGHDGGVPEALEDALAALRPMLLDVGSLVRAVAAGRRRGTRPAHQRAELRPVDLRSGRHLQVVTSDATGATTSNHLPGLAAETTVDALLAEPFGNWHVETAEQVVQLRVTKRGEAQVHITRTSRRAVVPDAGHDRVKRRLLDPADPLFDVLGAGADKRRQVDAFLRQLEPLVEAAAERARTEDRRLHVVDLGCGNAYLTFAAHRYLQQRLSGAGTAVRTVGIDQRPDMVARNASVAERLTLEDLSFVVGEIAEADPGLEPADLVLALHACDTATDDALARAVRWGAAVTLAAPCCHHDIQRQLDEQRREGAAAPHPYQALRRHRILSQRFADLLTDALRADVLQSLGFAVDVVEFIDSRHTPRNALLRVRRSPGVGGRASERAREAQAELAELGRQWHVRPRLADHLADLLTDLPAPGENR
jgi:SAM-dependent methyltransferase